ncbi:MAG: hypothetical protein JO051_01180 [Acidobacteriaceae bacterium]|nr:hypothetical protein [Acidobacteriaceae bacterium]
MVDIRQKLSRYILVSLLAAVCAFTQTSTLSQIQDTVNTSAGTAFNGTVVITWTGNTSSLGTAPFNTSVKISNGVLSVLLAPSTTITPIAYYQAVYNSSDGLTTWTETWAVPPSPTPLTLSQVKVTNANGSGGGGSGSGGSGQIQISNVIGLSSDLTALNSAISDTNATTQNLNLLITNLSNTVSGLSNTVGTLTGGGTTANFVDDETPAGSINGSNAVFTLAQTPAAPTDLTLYLNGLLQELGTDYTLSGTTITFASDEKPQTGDELLAFYRIAGTGAAANFVDAEAPVGTVNGTNLTFSLTNAPNPASSLKLFKNGALLAQNIDYALSNQTITFASAAVTPMAGDSLSASYRTTSRSPSISVSRDVSAPARQDR